MDAFARRDANHFLAELAQQHALFGDLRIGGSDADDVAFGHFRIETEQQVGRTQMEEMQRVRLQDLSVVHQAPHFLGSRRERGAHDHVHRFGCGQMMAYRADAAQPLHHHRRFPVRPSLDEFFETAKLDDVQPHLMHAVVLVQQQRHLAVAFDARHGIDGDAAQFLGVGGGFQIITHIQNPLPQSTQRPQRTSLLFSVRSVISVAKCLSIIFNQPMPQFRRLARDEVGEEFPDGVGGRRAAGDEVIDLHHFVQRMHLVQRQR